MKYCVLLFFLYAQVVQAAPYVVADAQYPAGSRMTSPWSGITFYIPDGYQGQYDQAKHAFSMLSISGHLLLLNFAKANETEQWSALKQSVQAMGISLHKNQQGIQVQHTELHATVHLLQGDDEQGGAIISLGSDSQQVAVQQLIGSLRWQTAVIPDRAWTLSGRSLSRIDHNETTHSIDFCSQNDVLSRQGNTQTQGNWKLLYDIGGEPLLLLQQDTAQVFSLDQQEGGLQLNQQAFDLGTATCGQ